MKIKLKDPRNMTTRELEVEFGLKEGVIAKMTTDPSDGTIEIETPLALTDKQKQALENKLGMRIISEG